MSIALSEAINHSYISNKIRRTFHPSNFGTNSWNFLKNHSSSNLKIFYDRVMRGEHHVAYRHNYRLRRGRPAPLGANVNNLRNFRKLPKTIHLRNNVRTSPPKKGENYTGRKQLHGTCWFQTILNGWLLSTEGRFIMRKKLQAFKKSHEMKPYTNTQSCPRRGVIPAYFWSYVEFMLNPKRNYYANVMRGKVFTEGKLIRNIGMRRGNQNVKNAGGTKKDVPKFMDHIFTKDERNTYFMLREFHPTGTQSIPDSRSGFDIHGGYRHLGQYKKPSRYLMNKQWRYELSHAFIDYGWNDVHGHRQAHAIAGYKSRGRYMIYDSNDNEPRTINWQKSPQDVKHYLQERYGKETTSFGITATYIKYLKPSNYNKPPLFKSDNNNFSTKYIMLKNRKLLNYFRNAYNKTNFINTNNNIKNVFNKDVLANKSKMIEYMILKNMNKNVNGTLPKLLPRLRRMYRLKYGKPAPSGSNVNFFKNKL